MRRINLMNDKSGKVWIWLIVIVILLAVIYFAFFFNKGGSTDDGTGTGSGQESNVDSAPASELNNLQNSDDDFAALDESVNNLE